MSRKSKRKCSHCNIFFHPDPRNRTRQKYCSKPGCRKASKAESQRRWLAKPENKNYFRNPENGQRVQRWRKEHPGYWRRNATGDESPLQDSLNGKALQKQHDPDNLPTNPLQDLLSAQHVVLIGLIANLTGSPLQDDIALTARRLRQLGDDILNAPTLQKGGQNGIQPTPTLPCTVAAPPETVQLAGPPLGP